MLSPAQSTALPPPTPLLDSEPVSLALQPQLLSPLVLGLANPLDEVCLLDSVVLLQVLEDLLRLVALEDSRLVDFPEDLLLDSLGVVDLEALVSF